MVDEVLPASTARPGEKALLAGKVMVVIELLDPIGPRTIVAEHALVRAECRRVAS
jgi:hypothetical protein